MNETRIEILTEEPSMEFFLRVLLPKILPEDYKLDVNCFIHAHEGKSHLQKSIPRKVRAYPHFGFPVKLLIVHDQDSNDCIALKEKLKELSLAIVPIPTVIRIACKELENWYFGDLSALEAVYPETRAKKLIGKAKFRNPDNVFGAYEIDHLTKNFSKTQAAREIPKYMNVESNTSPSFQHFVSGLNKLIYENN